jgi:hypothetical protein
LLLPLFTAMTLTNRNVSVGIWFSLPEGMFKEVMNDLWLTRISSLPNEVGLYVVLLEVLLFMPNSLIISNHSLSKYIKRDYFNFLNVNFPFLCSNIIAEPAH